MADLVVPMEVRFAIGALVVLDDVPWRCHGGAFPMIRAVAQVRNVLVVRWVWVVEQVDRVSGKCLTLKD
jgi:hypothetical protein